MIFHLIFTTSFGEAALIYRQNPFALLETLLPRQNRKDLEQFLKGTVEETPAAHEKAIAVSDAIIAYSQGQSITPPWEWLDMSSLTRLQQAVLVAVADIPYGQLKSYRDIAESIGRPHAYRFVGTALANNPFPILIPCHRVVRSDGTFGRFGGGKDLKRKLIGLEVERLAMQLAEIVR
jgi:methylated-DNA-[protein]-cysteine S-methyltransferase